MSQSRDKAKVAADMEYGWNILFEYGILGCNQKILTAQSEYPRYSGLTLSFAILVMTRNSLCATDGPRFISELNPCLRHR